MVSFLYSAFTISGSISLLHYGNYPMGFLFLTLYSTERIVDAVREIRK